METTIDAAKEKLKGVSCTVGLTSALDDEIKFCLHLKKQEFTEKCEHLRLDSYCSQIREYGKQLIEDCEKTLSMVKKIPNHRQQQVLILRYGLCGIPPLTWEEIADRCNLSIRTLYIAHGQGLQAFARILEQEQAGK